MSNRKFDLENYDIKFENIMFYGLLFDSHVRSATMPILKQEYFDPPNGEYPYNLIFKYIHHFYMEEAHDIDAVMILHAIEENEPYLEPEDMKLIRKTMKEFWKEDDNGRVIHNISPSYVIKEIEKFAQDKAIEQALFDSVEILKDRPEEKMGIASILSEALSVGLERNVGLNYNEDVRSRFEFYQQKEDKIPFLLEKFNTMTYNGFPRKTLNCFMAGTGIGKTLIMTSLVTDYIKQGYNVLYVSLEISEERIALRNDANLMEIPIGEFGKKKPDGSPYHDIDTLVKKFNDISNKVKDKKLGQLRIKEYPTGSINTMQIKALLKELRVKEGFSPDVIAIDYINLLNSARKLGKNANSYGIVKAVAEELRGIAVEENAVMITATQTNRGGISGEEVALGNVSESAGLPHTTDFFCGIFQNPDQRSEGIVALKILKNRFSSHVNETMLMGISYEYMRLHQLASEKEAEIVRLGKDEIDETRDTEVEALYVKNSRKRR